MAESRQTTRVVASRIGVVLLLLAGLTVWGVYRTAQPVDSAAPSPRVIQVTADRPADTPELAVDFNRDIRPILSDKCFACHGPDPHDRKAELRLDVAEDGDDYFGGYLAIEPGEPDKSELIGRIHSKKAKRVMPPPDSGLKLTEQDKALLRRWIEQGAQFDNHWAFNSIQRPDVPETKDQAWARNAIDAFVRVKLEALGMQPSKEAPRHTLLRRLTLDLTGLPPTMEALDAFLADTSDDAYEKAVDRLLASPRFGERMALPWLDAARYADTNGFSIDDHRDMWLWREWVIDAFNRNMPYDQFLIEQLAGDHLPNATQANQLATGFLRNSMNTHEGGTIPAEYRVIYIADKIDTVSTVFMGLTMRCAQCHDHKYDPLSMREYYQMYAFFDTADVRGYGATNANTPPTIRMDGPITDNALWKRDIEQRIGTLKRYLVHPPELVKARAEWEREQLGNPALDREMGTILRTPAQDRSDEQWQAINVAFAKTTRLWGRHVSTIKREIAVLEADLKAGQSSVMVMKEKGPTQTYVLTRGEYDKPDKEQGVRAGVPDALPPMVLHQNDGKAEGDAPSRLDLARWLVRPDHPLTARVAVNRAWQMLFGRGLVSTPNDFGSQGAYPTHPELLDYLASQYIESGWDTKALIKSMVMSATYRQSSSAPRTDFESDPYNALLARASRVRLPAEFIRDGALAISGQLDPRIGGPSVYPSQPHGLWREVSHFGYGNAFTAQAFYPSEEDGLTRRSMYTFWKRTSPPPSLTAFDAPSREVCVVQRSRTNTPLQALVLLNDPEYFNAARELARLAQQHAGDRLDEKIDFMFRRTTARPPESSEKVILFRQFTDAYRKYMRHGDSANEVSKDGSPALAALTVVASTILNLDETITRE